MATTVGQLEIQLIADVARLQRDMEKMNSTVKRNTSRMNSSIASTVNSFKNLIGVVGVAGLGRAIAQAGDSYTKFNAQLKQATKSQDDFRQAQSNVIRIAKVAQAEVSAIGTVYARFTNALRDNGATQDSIAAVTETLTLALKVNGATSEETSSAMLQLSQAFGKGKLDGDEFRTAMEAMPNVMRDLATSMGVPFGALKDLAKQGVITSDVLLKAFSNPELLENYRKNAKETETIAGAWQNVKNAINLAIGAAVEYLGLVPKINQAANTFAEAFSEGGLFGGKTAGQQRKADQDRINMLQGILDRGSSGFAGMDRAAMAAEISRLKRRSFGVSGNQLASGGLDNFTGAPNFSNGVIQVDDVDKIHAAQKAQDALDKQRRENARRLAEEEKQRVKDQNDYFFKETMRVFREKQENEKKAAEESAKRVQEAFEEHQRLSKERERIAEREAENIAREFERQSDIISRSLADSIFRGFENGKSFAENFLDALKNMFRTTILQPVVKLLVDSSGLSKLMMAVTGAFSGSASASQFGGSGGGIMGALGGIKDVISSLNGSLVESIQGLSGDLISNGFDKLGGFLFQNSALISKALPFAGAALQLLSGDVKGGLITGGFTAAGTAIGGPVGGAIGSVIGKVVGGLFGGEKLPPRMTESRTGRYSNAGFTAARGTLNAYGDPLGGGSSLDAVNLAFSQSLARVLTEFGFSDSIATRSTITKKKSTESGFQASFDGGSVSYYKKYGKDVGMEAIFQDYINNVLGKGLSDAIRNSSLPAGIKKFFDGLTDRTGVNEAINAIISVKNAIGDLPPVFEALNFELTTTAFKSNTAQLTARFNAVQQYTNLFYTDAEKLETVFKQLTTQFNSLDQTLPATREEFRALVDNFQVFDEASANTFYGLVSLAPALDAYYNALSSQKDILNDLANTLDSRRFSTYADFVSAQATIASGGDASGFMARINNPVAMSQVMAEEVKMLRESNAEMKTILAQIAFNTKKTKDIQREWNGDGLPTERTY